MQEDEVAEAPGALWETTRVERRVKGKVFMSLPPVVTLSHAALLADPSRKEKGSGKSEEMVESSERRPYPSSVQIPLAMWRSNTEPRTFCTWRCGNQFPLFGGAPT